MIRTRDFFLFLLCVAFLILAISVTWLTSSPLAPSLVVFDESQFDVSDIAYTAEVISSPNDREERLENLRRKLTERGSVISSAPVPSVEDATPVVDIASTTEEEITPVIASVQKCSNYAARYISWNPSDVKFAERSGVRVVYTETTAENNISPDASSTESVQDRETILVQLPIRSTVSASVHCLPSEIIGIALDGSLMRNNEQSLYGVFGEVTLIGYALDGFPIYGQSNSVVIDSCGGAMVEGSYRYFISGHRDGILGCFAGVPVTI